jgi:hypothetical protein
MAKVIYEKVINGETRLINATTPAGNQGSFVKTLVGAGNKFWWWPTIPAGVLVACDFTDAPTCTADPVTNNALIAAITVDAADVLTFA